MQNNGIDANDRIVHIAGSDNVPRAQRRGDLAGACLIRVCGTAGSQAVDEALAERAKAERVAGDGEAAGSDGGQ